MSSIDSFAAAFDGLKQSFESGRTAHAYLIIGSPRGNGLALAESFLQLLFCEGKDRPCGECTACRRIKDHLHPDVMWLEPESRSRRIDIQQIREQLNPRIAQTSYGGGWKAGVLVHADRMTDAAANAFLKTLEEPPGKSVLLLLTDAAQYLLPTIVSRCQRIMLGSGEMIEGGEWMEALLDVLRLGAPGNSIQVMVQAGLLKGILDTVKAGASDEAETDADEEETEGKEIQSARVMARVLEARTSMMRAILIWKRDVLLRVLGVDPRHVHYQDELRHIDKQAEEASYAEALAEVRAVEEMVRRLERNLPAEAVFEVGLA